jgi:hypothetical protein
MDATRLRRTRDHARQRWYALFRSFRFARHLGFTNAVWRPEKTPCPVAPIAATVAR